MYRALYRKWRPQRFEDVVGQEAIVTALRNQITAGRIGHAYLFTGTRGTGKTTCAKIFAKAVNCLDPAGPDPCGKCEVCLGIDNGSVLDVAEIDAASNTGVDNIRELRDDTAFLPTVCRYKVYIIDEVHMLSAGAFNALLKTMEEPPEHVIFILATTEVQKVPPTILSRCQRYDFARIRPDQIAARISYIAGQESITLTPEAAGLIARLADGALRDALSILDTCAGVDQTVDEALVRRMAGVTDKTYLFEISDAIAAQNTVSALEKIAELRQQSVDMRRLCMELTAHYRNLMLCALPGGSELLTGVSPEEEARYAQCGAVSQEQAIRAIQTFGETLEKMSHGADQRIELELAIFSLTQTPQPVAVQPVPAAPAAPPPGPAPFAVAPQSSAAPAFAQTQPVAESTVPQSAPASPPWPEEAPAGLPEVLNPSVPPAPGTMPSTAPAPDPQPAAAPPRPILAEPQLLPQWPQVMERLKERGGGAFDSLLHVSKAYYDGRHVLIECDDLARDFLKKNRANKEIVKQAILDVTGIRCNIGPYQPENVPAGPGMAPVEETIEKMQSLGVDVVVDDK
jgi:DNA polymerase-3 subunit gamma/tau